MCLFSSSHSTSLSPPPATLRPSSLLLLLLSPFSLLSVSFDKQICRQRPRITTSFDSQLTVNSQSQGGLHYINGKLDYFLSLETEGDFKDSGGWGRPGEAGGGWGGSEESGLLITSSPPPPREAPGNQGKGALISFVSCNFLKYIIHDVQGSLRSVRGEAASARARVRACVGFKRRQRRKKSVWMFL